METNGVQGTEKTPACRYNVKSKFLMLVLLTEIPQSIHLKLSLMIVSFLFPFSFFGFKSYFSVYFASQFSKCLFESQYF